MRHGGEPARGDRAELLVEGRGIGREVDEEVAVPRRGRGGVQRVVAPIEVRHLVHVRRGEEAPVEAVRPGMVRALDAVDERAVGGGAEPRAAVPAEVVEGAWAAFAVADDDEALARELAHHEPSGVADLLVAPHRHPAAEEEALEILAEDVRVRVVAGRQRARGRRQGLAGFLLHAGISCGPNLRPMIQLDAGVHTGLRPSS